MYENFAAFYDVLQKAGTDYESIYGFYHNILLKNSVKNGILLDLACGTGILSRFFSQNGYDVIGVDVSPEMLSEALNKPHNGIQYICQDMTRLDLYGTIDCCICAMDGINHLPGEKAVSKAFSRVSLFMNKGGLFVFDVNTLYKHEKILAGNTFIYDLGDIYCVWQNSACKSGTVGINIDIFAGETGKIKKYSESFAECAYSLDEINGMLKTAGFGEIEVYNWLTENPPEESSEKIVFAAVKL